MSEAPRNLGVWLASNISKFDKDQKSLEVYVSGSRSKQEVLALLTPLSKKLESGISVWAPGLSEEEAASSNKLITFKTSEQTSYDLIIYSPRSVETIGQKYLRQEIPRSLTSIKKSPNARIILCVPSSAEKNPLAIRVRM